MKNFNLFTGSSKFSLCLAILVSGLFFNACQDTANEDDPIVEGKKKTTIVHEIHNLEDFTAIKSNALKQAVDTNNIVIAQVLNNIPVFVETVTKLAAVGELENGNVRVMWVSTPSKSGPRSDDDNENYYVYPVGDVPVMGSMTQGVQFGSNSEGDQGNGKWVADNDDTAETIKKSQGGNSQGGNGNGQGNDDDQGVETFKGGDIRIYYADALPPWWSIVNGSDKKTKLIFCEELAPGSQDVRTNNQSTTISAKGGNYLGLSVMNRHMELMKEIADKMKSGKGNVQIENPNLMAGEHRVNTTAQTMKFYSIVSDGKYNNGNMFKIKGADGLYEMISHMRANGANFCVATDTLSIGEDGANLDYVRPETGIINTKARADIIFGKHAGYNGSEKMKLTALANSNEKGGREWLTHWTGAEVAMFSSPAAPNVLNAKYEFVEDPVLTKAIEDPYVAPQGGQDGCLSLDYLDAGHGSYSYEKLRASVRATGRDSGSFGAAILASDTTEIRFATQVVKFQDVVNVCGFTGGFSLQQIYTAPKFVLDCDSAKIIFDEAGSPTVVIDILNAVSPDMILINTDKIIVH